VPANHLYRANGKLLISGEYLVMDGALALGLPLSLGQSMKVKESSGSEIIWESHLPSGETWFKGKFDLFTFDPIKTSNEATAEFLKSLFEAAVRLNSDFLSKWKKYTVGTYLDFDPEWGLGSSSTLISCLAEWADVDAYDLLQYTMGGSGYDVACAKASGPIFYRVTEEEIEIDTAEFAPNFHEQLYFIYLGHKQSTAEAIAGYNGSVDEALIDEISSISRAFCDTASLDDFESLIKEHENIVGKVIKQTRIRDQHFSDFWGEIKSLGAWGGDFILVTSDRPMEETKSYFCDRGFDVIYKYSELVFEASSVPSSV
jgi:mevalonate kinase